VVVVEKPFTRRRDEEPVTGVRGQQAVHVPKGAGIVFEAGIEPAHAGLTATFDDEQTRLFGVFSAARAEFDLSSSVQLVLQVLLQSPQFIYLLEPAATGAAPGSV